MFGDIDHNDEDEWSNEDDVEDGSPDFMYSSVPMLDTMNNECDLEEDGLQQGEEDNNPSVFDNHKEV